MRSWDSGFRPEDRKKLTLGILEPIQLNRDEFVHLV